MKNLYRNVGIGLLIVNVILLLIGFVGIILPLIFLPTFYIALLETISVNGLYGKILFFLFSSLYTLFGFWGVIISIKLIRKNEYTKQLLFWVGFYVGIKILSFILYFPLWIIALNEAGQLPLILHFPLTIYWNQLKDLILGVLIFVFLIFQDNKFSRIIKGKIGK